MSKSARGSRPLRAVGPRRLNWAHLVFGAIGLVFAVYVFFVSDVLSSNGFPATELQPRAASSPSCCIKAQRGDVATSEVLRFAQTLLALGPRVGGGAGGGDGYFSVLELLATGPPGIDYEEGIRRSCPCLGSSSLEYNNFMWDLSWDNFTDDTPLGPKTFSNLIWTFDPAKGSLVRSPQHIVLGAHWDSKMINPVAAADGRVRPFLGACDSAVPVAMLAVLMHIIQHRAIYSSSVRRLPKFTIMFFDGEEAFVDWKGLDNTYGSRHLAKKWAADGLVDDISLFVLLDLLGPAGPTFRNFFPERTGSQFNLLRRIEKNLRQIGSSDGSHHLMRTNGKRSAQWGGEFFPADSGFKHGVDDDHKPWLDRNVSVLHLIPVPFPSVWHTVEDDASAVDSDTVHDLLLVFEEFVSRLLKDGN